MPEPGSWEMDTTIWEMDIHGKQQLKMIGHCNKVLLEFMLQSVLCNINSNKTQSLKTIININYMGEQKNCCMRFFSWFRMNLMRWIQKSHWFCSTGSSFWVMATSHIFRFCSRDEHFRRNWWGKIRCGITISIRVYCYDDKKYSG